MASLNWIGKEKVVNHHLDVPYRILNHKYGFSSAGIANEEIKSGNLIIEGDNLEALKSLLLKFSGKIKCITIDPPYNTGEENWVYNDNVNHPKIKQWFKQVVGKEGDDLTRHDKWLCMMYPRLKLMHKLLSSDGVIFINIDDNELHNLTTIMNEIFGSANRLAILIWDLGSGTSAGHFTRAHEYILVYAKNKSAVPNFSGGEGFIDDRAIKKISYKNPASEFTFPAGTKFLASDGYRIEGEWGDNEKCTLIKGDMLCQDQKLVNEVTISAGWTQKKQMVSWFSGKPTLDTKGQEVVEFYFRENGKIYCRKKRDKINPASVLKGLGSSKTGSSELLKILGPNEFNFPKPSDLIKFLIDLVTVPGDIILDSFAGSGTAGHAVLKLNSEQEARFFILIQMIEYNKKGEEVNICEQITAERIKKAISGYDEIEGLEGSFDYFELGEPIFKEDGNLNEVISEGRIREYIYYTETGQHLQREQSMISKYLLDNYNNTGYYFYYEKENLTTLCIETLTIITELAEQYIIYADHCYLDKDFMQSKNIIFKKIPRDVKKF